MLTLLDRPTAAPDQTHILRALLRLMSGEARAPEARLALEVLADASRKGALQAAIREVAAG